MKMNKEVNKCEATEPVQIPAALITQMFFDVHSLANMHMGLIHMYEKESQLKKQHKAYLHVREEADEMCKIGKQSVEFILDHYKNPKDHEKSAIWFHNFVNGISDNCCEDCPFEDCEDRCGDSHREDETPDETVAGEKETLDAFDLPHDMVMMSTGTLKAMQDDMLMLTMAVEQLVDEFRKIEESGGYNRNKMNQITGSASNLARDVFNRWDDADLGEIE